MLKANKNKLFPQIQQESNTKLCDPWHTIQIVNVTFSVISKIV
jgi:hypothetical protein